MAPGSETPTADAAVARIRERAADIRDRELDTALSKLDARGDLSASEREAIADLADRLVDELLAVPESSLREAAATGEDDGDDATVETAVELFS